MYRFDQEINLIYNIESIYIIRVIIYYNINIIIIYIYKYIFYFVKYQILINKYYSL